MKQIEAPADASQIEGHGMPVEQTDDERRAGEEQKALREATLDAIGVSLASSRSAAMNARQASGIELEWEQDEEHYEGVDDVNRGERRSWRGKPPGQAEASSGGAARSATSSTVFINITRPYCDGASARVGDMLLPTDDRAWSLNPTPVPDLAGMAEGNFPPEIVAQAAVQFPGQPDLAKKKLHDAVDKAVEQMARAKEKSDKAQTRIEDWHVECQYHGEMREVIEDATKIGTGIMKGPVPAKKRALAFVDGALVMKEEIKPVSYRIDPWNFYPDPACGEHIHDGSHCWEKDDISERALMALIGTPGYLTDQIHKVLEEGVVKATRVAPERPLPDGYTPDRNSMFEIWYFHGTLSREDLQATGCTCPEGVHMALPAQVTMVNNRVIRAIINPLEENELPYDVMVWQKRTGHWAGIGVSRQVRTPQEMVAGAGRMLMDNSGRAAGPMLVYLQGMIQPADGESSIEPWKVWVAGEDADPQFIDKAFRFVTVPMLEKELMSVIQLGMKLAEDVTGLPLLMQGQQGRAPDTVGGMQLLNNNASTVLRRIARLYDDRITEPHVRRYYTYLMIYGEDEEKGDFQIDARGSSALVQRDIENQSIGEMVKMVGNPIFGLDPKKWAAEWLKAKHLAPERFEFDDEDWKKIVANLSKGEQDQRLAVAQLRASTDEKLAQMEQAWETGEKSKDRELTMLIAQIDAQLSTVGLTADQTRVLAEIKGRLGETVLKLRAQREMQAADQGHARVAQARDQAHERTTQLLEPPVEPAGRAENGKAFIQ